MSHQKILGLCALSRPVNVAITAGSIYVAVLICADSHPLMRIVLACLSGALITAAANAINDMYDIDIDRINKPDRPLPRRRVTMREARMFALLCFGLGVGFSVPLGKLACAIALSCSILLYLYSARLKRTALWGNGSVSLATALAFFYGGVAAGRPLRAAFPAGFAFLMHFGREIIKDMEDIEGDRAQGASTFPIVHGLRPAKQLVTLIYVILLLATYLPYALGSYGSWYLFIVVLGVQTVLVFSILSLWIRPFRENFRLLSAVLKADMIVGLLAIYAGRW